MNKLGIILTFISVFPISLISDIYGNNNSRIKPGYSLEYSNYNGNNHEILASIGIIQESPANNYVDHRFLKIGIGELWRGKKNDLIYGFSLLEFNLPKTISILSDYRMFGITVGDINADGIETLEKLYFQFGASLLNIEKNNLYDMRLEWAGISSELIFFKNGWVEKPYHLSEISDFELQANLAYKISVVNNVFSHSFDNFGKELKINNLGVQNNISLQIGLLSYNKFFAGINCGFNSFYSALFPVTELKYGAKLYYLFELEKFKYFFSRNLELYLNYSIGKFQYGITSKDLNKLECGVRLYYLPKDVFDR